MIRSTFVVLAACTAPTSSQLAIESIAPASATNEAPVPVQIAGSFHLMFTNSLDEGPTVAATPAVTIGDTPLDSTSWQGERLIAGTVPAGLAPGSYDVGVELGGERATLPAGYTVLDNTPVPPAAPFALTGANWLLPCIANGTPNPSACTCDPESLVMTRVVGGTPGERWHVTVHIRGVLEHMTYSGGTKVGDGGWYAGGAPSGGNNVYKLTITAPPAVYFLNHADDDAQSSSWPHDYQATFDVEAGATLTFEASGEDGIMWEGVDSTDQPISIPGITDPPQPYNGQFARLDVLGAVPY